MSDAASYEQAFKILDLEAALKSAQQTIADLNAQVADLSKSTVDQGAVKELESQMERQRLELLASQRETQLAQSALEKAKRELPSLKEKLNASEKERKALKALNPERLKKQLNEQKSKLADAKAASVEWQQRLKAARKEADEDIDAVKLSLKLILGECDYFCESDLHQLTLSRFAFEGDNPNVAPLRIRVTHRKTSASAVVMDVVDGEPVFAEGVVMSDLDADSEIKASIAEEHASIQSTGKCTQRAYDSYDQRRAEYVRLNK